MRDLLYASLSEEQKAQLDRNKITKRGSRRTRIRSLLYGILRLCLVLIIPAVSSAMTRGYLGWDVPASEQAGNPKPGALLEIAGVFRVIGYELGRVQASITYALLGSEPDLASFYAVFLIMLGFSILMVMTRRKLLPLCGALFFISGPLLRAGENTYIFIPFIFGAVMTIPFFIGILLFCYALSK